MWAGSAEAVTCLLPHMCKRRTTLQEEHLLVQEEIHQLGCFPSLGSQIILNLIATGQAAHIGRVLTLPFITLHSVIRSSRCLTVLGWLTGCPCLVVTVYYTVIKTSGREDRGHHGTCSRHNINEKQGLESSKRSDDDSKHSAGFY